jgi:hypothetical protein
MRALLAGAAALGLLLTAAAAWRLHQGPGAEAVMVGTHVVGRGTHLDGERLPAPHPLTTRVSASALETEPEGFDESPGSELRVRRHCAWGLPGRNPYRGSPNQALQTAQLSAHVVQKISADIRAGRKVDRVRIDNAKIVATGSGRVFDNTRVAMTYGMTLCVDTRVNFRPGHSEGGDLYEAMDEDGRIYAVMVPDVCGNVSVLGQRHVAESAAAASAPADRPWMRWPAEERPRLLPDALLYADEAERGRDGKAGGANEVPEPGTLLLASLALALAAALGWMRHGRD